ncbi:MAG: hypothetical protein QM611_00025 [Microbacterium sp.]|uniref:hypothetical protein n=1 Tax=Microbacterium sp. TaxID=51671 RepID=UPI0039E725E6
MSDILSSRPWWDSPLVRLAGATLSWLVFAASCALLVQSALALVGLGGVCGGGEWYATADECPTAVAVFTPLSLVGLVAAVLVSVGLARGFGMQLPLLAWPIMFCGLGGAFVLASVGEQHAFVWALLGLFFAAMGLLPLVLVLRADAQAAFSGARAISGSPLQEDVDRPSWWPVKHSRAETTAPQQRDWLLAVVPALAAAGVGLWLGVALFRAAAG